MVERGWVIRLQSVNDQWQELVWGLPILRPPRLKGPGFRERRRPGQNQRLAGLDADTRGSSLIAGAGECNSNVRECSDLE